MTLLPQILMTLLLPITRPLPIPNLPTLTITLPLPLHPLPLPLHLPAVFGLQSLPHTLLFPFPVNQYQGLYSHLQWPLPAPAYSHSISLPPWPPSSANASEWWSNQPASWPWPFPCSSCSPLPSSTYPPPETRSATTLPAHLWSSSAFCLSTTPRGLSC